MAMSRREQLLTTAITLFARHGFHATGIDRIAAESKVSKKTMYQFFRSKDELIVAALRDYDSKFRNDYVRDVEAKGRTPQDRMLAVFDVARDWFSGPNFHGCVMIRAAGEFAGTDANNPIRRCCSDAKRALHEYIGRLAKAAKIPDPASLAGELALLLEGATVMALINDDPDQAKIAKKAAATLIAAAQAHESST